MTRITLARRDDRSWLLSWRVPRARNSLFPERLAGDILNGEIDAASDPPYIEAALDQAATEYGSLDAYLEKRLDVGPAQRARLQARYVQ